MQEELLKDVRALLVQRRAAQLRGQLEYARSDEDILVVMDNGKEHRMLTWELAIRLAVAEMRENAEIIERALDR